MDHHDLTGYYTYRGLLNRQEPADDFNVIRFAEGELFLYVTPDGAIRGTLAFPADPLAGAKDFMDVTGRAMLGTREDGYPAFLSLLFTEVPRRGIL
jgi:hypothetical protein